MPKKTLSTLQRITICLFQLRVPIGRSRNPDRSPLLRILQRDVQSQPLPCRVCRYSPVGVRLGDELLAPRVDQQADEVRPHVVACEVGEDLCEVGLVEVDLDVVSLELLL